MDYQCAKPAKKAKSLTNVSGFVRDIFRREQEKNKILCDDSRAVSHKPPKILTEFEYLCNKLYDEYPDHLRPDLSRDVEKRDTEDDIAGGNMKKLLEYLRKKYSETYCSRIYEQIIEVETQIREDETEELRLQLTSGRHSRSVSCDLLHRSSPRHTGLRKMTDGA